MTSVTGAHVLLARIWLHGHIHLQSSLGIMLGVSMTEEEERRDLGNSRLTAKVTNARI